MSGPQVHTEADGVVAHPHHTGARAIDLLLAGSAILISTVSLFIGFHHARTEERLVAAASRPILFYTTGNQDAASRYAPPACGERS